MILVRAREAPVIRRMFSSSPRDPRYHMLSYISSKFSKPVRNLTHEPRAALFLNRFSRTLTIMYATNGMADIIGIPASDLCGKSFYYCIQENCLRDAVKCLESAKANDSIAYLRFWFRDPRQDNRVDHDEHMSDGHSSGDEDDGGVHLSELMDHDGSENAVYSDSSNSLRSSVEPNQAHIESNDPNSRTSSGNSTDLGANNEEAIFDRPDRAHQSSSSSISTPDEQQPSNESWSGGPPQIELEAVVSCTSDGLVVVLRRAKPTVCHLPEPLGASQRPFANGYFASPWASDPILPVEQSNTLPNLRQPSHPSLHPTAMAANMAATRGPASEDFMNSIREVAVFAWALTGINGSLEQYGRGTPSGESQPPGGLPVWDPRSSAGLEPERPIGGAYYSNNQKYDTLEQTRAYRSIGPASGSYSNGYMPSNGGQNHAVSNNSLTNHQNNHEFHATRKTDPRNQEYSDMFQADDSNGATHSMGPDNYMQTNGHHNSVLPNGSWTQHPEQQTRWATPFAGPQSTSNMSGRHDEARGFR